MHVCPRPDSLGPTEEEAAVKLKRSDTDSLPLCRLCLPPLRPSIGQQLSFVGKKLIVFAAPKSESAENGRELILGCHECKEGGFTLASHSHQVEPDGQWDH